MQAPHFTAMLAMVEAKKLDPGKLVSRTVGLEDVTSVIESMGSYGTSGVTVIAQY
jgi:threonine dehydrogenase-like Zn-dependent dehydrogenase